MTDSRVHFAETEQNILLYLKSQQVASSNVDVSVKNVKLSGKLQIRKGQTVSAACGKLVGNGALLTLAAIRDANIEAETSIQPVESNVSLSLTLVERLLRKVAHATTALMYDQEESLQQAIHLIYQFRRTEAGSKLVEVLRSNRFYYPAWLWHSRLMTREDYLKKALAEARKWGNCDLAVQREHEKIEPQFSELSQEKIKRCIFCWSLVIPGEMRCKTCQGVMRISNLSIPKSNSSELMESLEVYERELQMHPENSRIAYCLCLGHFSLGNVDRAREFIEKALKISPREPIFLRSAAMLVKQAAPVVRTVPTPRVSSAPSISAGKKTILVVEDSPTSRKVISMLLERKGYAILQAVNGTEALQRCEETIPDLVLLDVMLPDMSGYEVLSRLRQSQRFAEMPVVMLTGKSKPSDRQKGLFHGSNEYLTKPFDPAKLLAVLEKYLDQPNAIQAVAAPAVERKVEPATQVITKPASASVAPAKAVAVKSETARPAVAPPAVTIPAKQAAVAVASPPIVSPVAVVSESKNGQTAKTILVVEDSPTSRKVITMVLAKRGYTIVEAPTGGEALRKMEAIRPSLILLDAMLPDMTGYDILFRLKHDARLKDVPVVMLTAKNNPVDRQKGMRGGSVAYLTKPFDPEKLLAVIDDNI
ncbi:MAG: response regulator [Pseudomonadota bacterium]